VEHLSGHMTSFRQINDGLDNIFCIRKHSNSLAKRERKGLNARIEELDLKSPAFHLIVLPDELIQTIRSNLALAVRSKKILAMIRFGEISEFESDETKTGARRDTKGG
jgi:hypothetical protein